MPGRKTRNIEWTILMTATCLYPTILYFWEECQIVITIFFLLIATSLAQCIAISWYSINICLINWMLQCFLNTDRRCMTFQICRVHFNHSIKYKLSLSLLWFVKCIWLFLLDIFSLYTMKWWVMATFPKKSIKLSTNWRHF